ncbi:MAG: zinc ribbon domain-containing protein [Deltaproteobacteria bacterium]|nr:zinc ribbon domain-containing protein [Deltaproteobacteria bacterium]
MPLFDYQCNVCDNKFSELRKIAEKDSEINCPSCDSLDTKRLLTTFSVGAVSGAAQSSCPTASSCSSAGQFG